MLMSLDVVFSQMQFSKPESVYPYLSNCICEDVNDLLMWCGYYTLPIDFNDAMANPNATPLCDAATH